VVNELVSIARALSPTNTSPEHSKKGSDTIRGLTLHKKMNDKTSTVQSALVQKNLPSNITMSGPKQQIQQAPVTQKQVSIHSYGALFTLGPGQLTPTNPGRIKAPPVCVALALKREAASAEELNAPGVRFSSDEAERAASLALALKSYNGDDDAPLALEKNDSQSSWKIQAGSASAAAEVKAFVSSNSTVVTNYSSSSSCEKSVMGAPAEWSGVAAVAIAAKERPPVDVVRTNDNLTDVQMMDDDASSATSLSAAHASKLLQQQSSSRQGRSLQRWLVHSRTEELVRQVAGCVPITRDGRIILVSAGRKEEWILPKGGWDADETKVECAARETYEEAGLLGLLGGCLDPVDYESTKAKKRRLNAISRGKTAAVVLAPLPCSKRARTEPKPSSASPGPPIDVIKLPSRAASSASPTPASIPSVKPTSHSYVRMFLFPMYVTCVKEEWPEGGRLRKLVTIDEAIEIMEKEKRKYFKRGLEMVRDRGLHLLRKS